MSRSIYQAALFDLTAAIQSYRHGSMGVEMLQRALQNAEAQIVAVDEKALRAAIHNAEADIEYARFMIGTAQQPGHVEAVLTKLEITLSAWRGPDGGAR